MKKEPTTGAQTLQRATQLLRLISSKRDGGLRLVDAVAGTGLTKPTVHRLLKEMVSSGLLAQGLDRQYHLGHFAYELGIAASTRFELRERCEPWLTAVATQTGDTAYLIVRSEDDAFCVDRKLGNYPIKVMSIEVGNRRPLGIGAGGLALLSCLPEAEMEAVIRRNAPRLPSYNGFSEKLLRRAVEATRVRGYALVIDVALRGVTAIGVPVRDRAGQIVGGMSVTSISARLDADRAFDVAQILLQQVSAAQQSL